MKLLSTENQIVHLYPVLVSYWAPVVGVAAEFNLIIVSLLATLHEMTFNKTDGCHLISPREREHIIKLTYFPHLCSPSSPIRGKLEKERKEKSRQLGLIKAEGSDGGEDMEREKRTFQLQMCEVGDQCQSKHQTQTTFLHRRGGLDLCGMGGL